MAKKIVRAIIEVFEQEVEKLFHKEAASESSKQLHGILPFWKRRKRSGEGKELEKKCMKLVRTDDIGGLYVSVIVHV